MHEGYQDIIEVFNYSIGEYIDMLIRAIYNVFQILLLEVDSNGNVIGLNFLGTCIACIILLYVVVWLVTYLVTNLSFGQTKDDLPTFSDIENEAYWENQFNNELKKDKINWKRAKYSREQALLFRNRNETRLNEQIRNQEIKEMRRWKQDRELKRYRKYKKYYK